jgi:transcriptional regulator with AAA-type ATPase domain/polyferredoxin
MAGNPTWRIRSTADGGSVEAELGSGAHVIGSSPECDITILDPTVSRRHASLAIDGGSISIEDLGSTNGTSVNGDRIDGPTLLDDGADIKLGRVRLHVGRIVQPAAERRLEDSSMSSGESVLLGPATVGFLRDAGEEVSFKEGDVVVRRGEHQEFFYVVIEGEVELLLSEDENRGRPLARLGEGGIFGAESALGKGGAAIGAIAVSDVRLLRYPASALPSALQESASLRRKLLGGFARNLRKTTSDAIDLMRGTEVMARLVQGDTEPDTMIAVSPRMKAVKRKIEELAQGNDAVMLIGEEGTGKTLAARMMHDASPRSSGPLIAVNCSGLRQGHAAELILGEDLGGRLPTGRRSSGGVHLAHGGTLVLRGADALEPAVQQMLASYISSRAEQTGPPYPDTRIIFTARSSEADGLQPVLTDSMEHRIELPPLAKRPKDIMPLAEAILAKLSPEPKEITEDARHALLSLRYPRRNVAELRDVLELAVRIADGPEIRAEHIFGDVGEEAATPGLTIADTPLLRTLLRPAVLPALRAATFAGFAAVIVLCLAFASSLAGRTANTLIWSVWEPVVFALFFFVGPVWCTVCPLSTGARLAKRLGWPGKAPPPWMLRHGPWLAIVGFALIVGVERVFDSTANPVPSGLLLLSLLAAAVACGLLYKREAWCRHLCPLGRLATSLAPASMVQVVAKPSVCASSCTTHECFKGTGTIPGCTVFHHPLEAKQAHRCKLCLDCLRSCPHHSANPQFRAPLMAVWRLDAGSRDLSLFALAVSLLALALVASRSFEPLGEPLTFTLLCVLVLVTGIALHALIMRMAGDDRRIAVMVRLMMTLMVLGWAALMVSQLANIVVLNQATIDFTGTVWLPGWLPDRIGVVLVLQVAVVLVGLLLAAVSLTHIPFEGTTVWTRIGRHLTPLLLVAYTAAVIFLLVL